jgi:hypothetical protein
MAGVLRVRSVTQELTLILQYPGGRTNRRHGTCTMREHQAGNGGVRAADALHVTTALQHDADLILSTDSGILNLDGKPKTLGGNDLRCLDSDAALSLLSP